MSNKLHAPGFALVIAAPSGAGKTTLARALVDRHDDVEFSVSATTRPKRTYEKGSRDYHFVDDAEFSRMQEAQDVLQAINARREELLAADSVDLVLLQAVDAFEAQAWSRLDTRRDEHAAARRQQDAAQDEHVAARARTRVAQTRHERLRAGERDQEEKLMFDRMADLYASHRSDRA